MEIKKGSIYAIDGVSFIVGIAVGMFVSAFAIILSLQRNEVIMSDSKGLVGSEKEAYQRALATKGLTISDELLADLHLSDVRNIWNNVALTINKIERGPAINDQLDCFYRAGWIIQCVSGQLIELTFRWGDIMAVDIARHKFVVVIDEGKQNLGFTTLVDTVKFLVEQLKDDDKVLGFIATALSGDAIVVDDTTYTVYGINEWDDVFADDDDVVV